MVDERELKFGSDICKVISLSGSAIAVGIVAYLMRDSSLYIAMQALILIVLAALFLNFSLRYCASSRQGADGPGTDTKASTAPTSTTAPAAQTAAQAKAATTSEIQPGKVAEPAPATVTKPAVEPVAGVGTAVVPVEADKPDLLPAARDSGPDDLKKIKGIGPKLERLCNDLGIWHYDQIASWTMREIAWVDHNLEGFKGRILRDDWVEQAKILAHDGDTEFSKRVDDGDVPSSQG